LNLIYRPFSLYHTIAANINTRSAPIFLVARVFFPMAPGQAPSGRRARWAACKRCCWAPTGYISLILKVIVHFSVVIRTYSIANMFIYEGFNSFNEGI